MEIWGGVECTVNRVGDTYRDQLRLTGHHARLDDLDRIAALGIRTLRYPVLWERADWRWTDERLGRLRALGITPIVTLCHHGSGPRSTGLLEASFAPGLAAFARQVAERYPWVEHYTPVNEPLTTARFSGLYGHWYPHRRDERAFVRMLFNELQATALAMREIRAVNPKAQLIQTEDFAAIHSTPAVRGQAEHENARRWLTFDVLCGRFENAALRDYLAHGLLTPDDLALFPCRPDLLGLNYYLTSERLLDDRVERYPPSAQGGNGRQRYADVEAVRAVSEGLIGHLGALRLAWERYRAPLAFTEVHLGCTREEQLRWLDEAWRALVQARDEGIDARALTVWALFGACDWNSLVTRDEGFYEPGAFDIRSPQPRETALAAYIREHARHPVLDVPGWWKRRQRFSFAPVATAHAGDVRLRRPLALPAHDARRLLITGGAGALGQALVAGCAGRAIACVATTRAELDLCDAGALAFALDRLKAWGVVNAAGYEGDAAERCARDNATAAALLAEACAARGLPLVTFSSDRVFDGALARPYLEHDSPAALSAYGQSKRAAERHVQALHAAALIVRTSALFGAPGDFVSRALAHDGPLPPGSGHRVAATYVPDLVHATLDLLLDGAHGIWHLVNRGAMTRAELVQHAAARLGVVPRAAGAPSEVSGATVLESARADLMPALSSALARYLEGLRLHAMAA